MKLIPGLVYQGFACYYEDAAPQPQPPEPVPPGTTVYPAELQSKQKSQGAMPWTSGTRLNGPTVTFETAWVVNFRTGAASTRNVRLAAVEREGGPIHRIGILFRRADGLVLARYASSSLTYNCLVGQPPNTYRIALEANTNYAIGIFNETPGQQGAMYMDLYL